jgi:hypothetical protein
MRPCSRRRLKNVLIREKSEECAGECVTDEVPPHSERLKKKFLKNFNRKLYLMSLRQRPLKLKINLPYLFSIQLQKSIHSFSYLQIK